MTRPAAGNPFRALGLVPDRELTADDVRAAWRRVATATHPDRADGGDPAAFAAAAAAYTVLRTAPGRGEALADLQAAPRRPTHPHPPLLPARRLRLLGARIRRGRPTVLASRVAVASVVGAIPVLAVGWQPASFAIIVGALTWLLRTARADLAPPP